VNFDWDGMSDLQQGTMTEESEQFEDESDCGDGWFNSKGCGDSERESDTRDKGDDGAEDWSEDSEDSSVDNEEGSGSLPMPCAALQLHVWSRRSVEDMVLNSLICSVTDSVAVGLYAHNTWMYARKTAVTAAEKVTMFRTVTFTVWRAAGGAEKKVL
jgi:hypothetical protein